MFRGERGQSSDMLDRSGEIEQRGSGLGRHRTAHANLDTIAPELPPLFGEAIVCSGLMRQSKPDPEAFLACLRRLRHEAPEDVLFIDDNADNVAGARRAGLDALLYTDLATLRRELRARGFDLQGDEHAS